MNLHGALFTTRNKDNKHLDNFKETSHGFLTRKEPHELMTDFYEFVARLPKGTMARFYYSVNARDNDKTKRALQHYLLDHPDYDMTRVPDLLMSLASKHENSAEKKWMFDYDGDLDELSTFVADVQAYGFTEDEVSTHLTPNGAAVVVSHGFDTRELLEKYKDVELKRDDMLCHSFLVNANE